MIRALLCWLGYHLTEQHKYREHRGSTDYLNACKHCNYSQIANDCPWGGWNP